MMDTLTTHLPTILASGASVALVSLGLEHWRHRRSRKDRIRHLALRIVFSLEGYAIECGEKLSDHKLAMDHDGQAGKYMSNVPQPPSFPDSLDYALMKSEILEAILDFPQRCQMADREPAFWWDVIADIDCVRNAASENTVKMGVRAIQLAQRIRKEYKLPERNLTFGKWDIVEFFEIEFSRISELDSRRAATDPNTSN